MDLNSAKKVEEGVDIEVTPDYRITANKFGWTIHTRRRNKDGDRAGWKEEYFLPTAASCLDTLFGLMTVEYSNGSFEELKANIVEIRDIIKGVTKELRSR